MTTTGPDPLVLAAALPFLREGGPVTAPEPAVTAALQQHGLDVRTAMLASLEPGSVATLALLDDELSHAGEHAEGLIAQAVEVLAPGGRLAVGVVGAVAPDGPNGLRQYRSDELVRALGHHGVELEVLAGPGAGALARR